MKKQTILFLLVSTLIATSAWAFGGGGGGGRVSTRYKKGVDAVGIHVDPDNPIIPPDWRDCNDKTEELIGRTCCLKELVYANGTKCCDKAGYEIKDGECQKICPTGLMPVDDECVNLCEGYEPTDCKPNCDPTTGEGKAGNEGGYCEDKTGRCANGTCEPIVCNPCEELIEGVCTPKTCGDNMHCDTTQNTCVCDEGYEDDGQGGCKEPCPTERQCGETCCGEGNICVGGNQCCNKDLYESYYEDEGDWMCCDANTSTGYDTFFGSCCSLEQTTYTTDEYRSTQCCALDNIYKGIGYNSTSVCCDHPPEEGYKDFKVCWTPETTCKTNADCGAGEFCNLKNETDWSCYYPTSGTCGQITTDDYTDANVEGLGNVRKSNNGMTWWAADNWCKAQGKSLIDVSKFGCYESNMGTLVEEGSEYYGGCCASGQTCSWNSSWYTSDNFWTASDFSSTDSCSAFGVDLFSGYVFDYYRNNYIYALCGGEMAPGDSCGTNKVFDENGACVCAEGFQKQDDQCLPYDPDCSSGVLKNTDGTCTVCTNENVYLSYMPEFGTGACDTSTPLNTATGCDCTNANGKCVSYERDSDWNTICAASDATPCTSNKDCASAEYCALTNSQYEDNQPDVGTCMPLTNGVPYTYNTKTFLRSDNLMGSWWSAENWCQAKGKKLVSLASTGMDNLGDYFTNNGFCYGTDAEKCENVDWDALNTAFPDIYENYWFWWTRDSYSVSSPYSVDLGSNQIFSNARQNGMAAFALCE